MHFGWVMVVWSQHGLIDFYNKKGIFSCAFYPFVQANEVSGSDTAYGKPVPQALKCQHITDGPSRVHAERLTIATQDFNHFHSTTLAGSVFSFLTGLGALREGVSLPFGRDIAILALFETIQEVERQAPLRLL